MLPDEYNTQAEWVRLSNWQAQEGRGRPSSYQQYFNAILCLRLLFSRLQVKAAASQCGPEEVIILFNYSSMQSCWAISDPIVV